MYDFAYQKPSSLADAVKALSADPDAKALAGGMTLIPVLKQRLNKPSLLVDLAKLGLTGVSTNNAIIIIGGMTTHGAVAANSDVKAKIPSLAELASVIGDDAVRHRGTIGGSLANNDPAADYPAAALALGATIKTDKRSIKADDFFQGMFMTALEQGETDHVSRVPGAGERALREVPQSGVALRYRRRVCGEDRGRRARRGDRRRAERRISPYRHGAGAECQLLCRCDRQHHDAGGRIEQRHPRQRRVSRASGGRDG